MPSSGPNGAGKSSLLRVLSGLWPLCGGTLTGPADPAIDIAYVPQTPYFFEGTLRDQLLYPKTKTAAVAAAAAAVAGSATIDVDSSNGSSSSVPDDAALDMLMKEVGLPELVAREGGWDAVRQWGDLFSGGEKQRVAMARLYCHCPAFAVLDEASAAVSGDIEAELLLACHRRGITMISISHRKHLRQFHTAVLTIHGDGEGGWSMEDISDQCVVSNDRSSV